MHVYVKRTIVKVEHKRHLGTTPFALEMGSAEWLGHGDTLIWEKTDYRPVTTKFASGMQQFHQVMQRLPASVSAE